MGYDNHADHLLPDDAVFIKQFELAAAQLKGVLESKVLGAGLKAMAINWALTILSELVCLIRREYNIPTETPI